MEVYIGLVLVILVICLVIGKSIGISELLFSIPCTVAIVGGGIMWFFDNLLLGIILVCLFVAVIAVMEALFGGPTSYTNVKHYEEMVCIIEDVADRLYYDEQMTNRAIVRDLMDAAENPVQPGSDWIPWFPNMPSEQYADACVQVARGF